MTILMSAGVDAGVFESPPEWFELPRVVAPLADGARVNRLAHLQGARGGRGLPVLVEAQALVLPGKAAVSQESLRLSSRLATSVSYRIVWMTRA
jgi:hypothetical protein